MTAQRGDISAEAVWHVVVTPVNLEFSAKADLVNRGYDVWLPWNHVLKLVKRSNGMQFTEWQTKALFPGYLFASVQTGQDVAGINAGYFVSTVVHRGDEALVVPGAVMDELRSRAGRLTGFAGKIDEATPPPPKRYKRGERVRFVEGSPLAGWLAKVDIDKKGQISLLFDELRGKLTVSAAQIEPA